MARSTYVYVIMEGVNIQGAFTVKKEMLSRVDWNINTQIYRVKDGKLVGERNPREDITKQMRSEWLAERGLESDEEFRFNQESRVRMRNILDQDM